MAREEKTLRLEFVKNTAYQGENYGPDYEESEANVSFIHARTFIQQGRARPARAKASTKGKAKAQPKGGKGSDENPRTGDPEPRTADPSPKKGSEKPAGKKEPEGDGPGEEQDPEVGDAKWGGEDETIPPNFPGHQAFLEAGILTFGQVAKLEDVEDVNGIGPKTAKAIAELREAGEAGSE